MAVAPQITGCPCSTDLPYSGVLAAHALASHALLHPLPYPAPCMHARMSPPPHHLFPAAPVIVKSSSGPRYVVGCRSKVDRAKLTPNTRVALDVTTLTIMRILPREVGGWHRERGLCGVGGGRAPCACCSSLYHASPVNFQRMPPGR